jgi:hypothetical protein
MRPASVDDSTSLDRAFSGAVCLKLRRTICSNCCAVIEAALRARIPYLDVAAEIEANLDTFEQYDSRARRRGDLILPAMAFMAAWAISCNGAMGDWAEADEISIAYGLDSWKPTPGTRAAGRVSRSGGTGNESFFRTADWSFARTPLRSPNGTSLLAWTATVVGEFTMATQITISRHLKTPEIRSYMTLAAVKDVSNRGHAAAGRD